MEKLRLEVDKSMIDRSHRIGPKKKDQKPRAIIVKFCSYRDRSKVFYNKKMLKGSNRKFDQNTDGLVERSSKNGWSWKFLDHIWQYFCEER